jgi:PhzF family phenazine biosynthesis protein
MMFTRQATVPLHIVQSRYFTPAKGVSEDPVTGAANGPLAAYLAREGVLTLPAGGGGVCARAEQGYAMGKPGLVELEVTGTREHLECVRIGGVAVTVMVGTLGG